MATIRHLADVKTLPSRRLDDRSDESSIVDNTSERSEANTTNSHLSLHSHRPFASMTQNTPQNNNNNNHHNANHHNNTRNKYPRDGNTAIEVFNRSVMTTIQEKESLSPNIQTIEYVWRLGNFMFLRRLSKMKALPLHHHAVRSQTFGDKQWGSWHIKLYPGASPSADTPGQNVRVFLCLDTSETPNAKADFLFSALDAEGNSTFEKRSKGFIDFSDSESCDCFGFNLFCSASDLENILVDGMLILKCEISVFMGLHSALHENTPPPPLPITSYDKTFKDDIIAYATNPKYQDTVVECVDGKVKACRFMLAARSKVFEVMLQGAFKENATTTMRIPDISKSVAQQMVTFVQTDRCETLNGGYWPDILDLLLAADRFQIEGLMEQCVDRLLQILDPENVLEIFSVANSIADSPAGARLHWSCRKYLKGFSALDLIDRLSGLSQSARHLPIGCDEIPPSQQSQMQPQPK